MTKKPSLSRLLLPALLLAGSALGQELLTNGTFDDKTITGWQKQGNVFVVTWPAGDPRGTSLVLGYENLANQRMWQDVTIPAGATATLRYSWYVVTEETSHPYDQLDIRLLDTAGNPLKAIETVTDGSETGHWVDRRVDLSAFAGQRVRFELHAVTDEDLSTQFLLDDLSIVAAASSGPKLERVFLANAQDQVTTQFRPGDAFRVYAEFSNVTQTETLALSGIYQTGAGVDLGTSFPFQMSVSPTTPRGRVDGSFDAAAQAGSYGLKVSFTRNGRTDTATTAFSIVTTTSTVQLARVFTADGNGTEKTDFASGDAVRLSILAQTTVEQTVTLTFSVTDPGGAAVEALSGSGDVLLKPNAAAWYLPATIPGTLAAGTYRYRGSVTAAGQTSALETTFRIGGTTTGTTTSSCDRAKAFVSDVGNVERTAYAAGQTLRLHVCVMTASTTPVDARIRFLVDDPQGVASAALSGAGAVRATRSQADWWIPRTVSASLATGTYTLRTVVELQGATSTYQTTFHIGGGGLPPAPELVRSPDPRDLGPDEVRP